MRSRKQGRGRGVGWDVIAARSVFPGASSAGRCGSVSAGPGSMKSSRWSVQPARRASPSSPSSLTRSPSHRFSTLSTRPLHHHSFTPPGGHPRPSSTRAPSVGKMTRGSENPSPTTPAKPLITTFQTPRPTPKSTSVRDGAPDLSTSQALRSRPGCVRKPKVPLHHTQKSTPPAFLDLSRPPRLHFPSSLRIT